MSINIHELQSFVEDNISGFHANRINSLNSLKLNNVLKRKNPYLFKAKNIRTAEEFIKSLLQAYLSSQEETIFGEFLEKLAIFVCGTTKGGYKSGIEGIDLEFEEDSVRYIITIKSGPNWGNSSQILKMQQSFLKAKKILRTQNQAQQIIAVNGCCYGRDNSPDKGSYFKYCGQRFWEFITNDTDFYTRIVEPLGYNARQKNEEFYEEYSRVVNRFTHEFLKLYCDSAGGIDWSSLVRFNSSKE